MVKPRKNEAPRRTGLARALSKLGYCSRSRAAQFIRAGRVSLNGKVCRDPETPVSGESVRIAVDGKLVGEQEKIYLMMNKPPGVVTTASDEKARATVYTLLDERSSKNAWVAPVGRLDQASAGLLLLTNDSEWGARITAPETHLDKTYHVQIATLPSDELIQSLVRGVIILDEGKNRQIRRMIESMGIEVLRLVRVAIGPVQLGDLAKGAHRPLTVEEKRMLDGAIRGEA